MKLSAKGQYAIIALADLASHDQEGPVSLSEIGVRQNLPIAYLEQLFAKLRQEGIVHSTRGSSGGYCLNQKASEIRIFDIINAVGEPIKTTRCNEMNPGGCLKKNSKCLTHNFWKGLEGHIKIYLTSVTLADLCKNQAKVRA